VRASRIATVFWGLYAIAFASYGPGFGALIETVNVVGSFFYGSMLGVFVLAFCFPRAGPRSAFYGVVVGEAAILAANQFTDIAWLWYNVVGCLAVLAAGLAISLIPEKRRAKSGLT